MKWILGILTAILGFLAVLLATAFGIVIRALPWILVVWFGWYLMTSCGPQHNEPGACPDTPYDNDTISTTKDCFVSEEDKAKLKQKESSGNTITVRGSVSPAFEVTVNNRRYNDMEDYFTNLSDELPKMVEDAGYTGVTVKLQASIGYSDLTNNMSVFVQSAGERGYQQKTSIDSSGNFSVSLPVDGAGDYKIKATKRLNVVLTQDNQQVAVFCYNFSAVDLDVPFAERDKPVILNNFQTSLTKYACDQTSPSSNVGIPKAKTETKTSTSTGTETSAGTDTRTSTKTSTGTNTSKNKDL